MSTSHWELDSVLEFRGKCDMVCIVQSLRDTQVNQWLSDLVESIMKEVCIGCPADREKYLHGARR